MRRRARAVPGVAIVAFLAAIPFAAGAEGPPAAPPGPAPFPGIAAARLAVADAFARSGNWYRGRDMLHAAAFHWREALRHDPDHAGSRAALGYGKGEGGRWTIRPRKDPPPDVLKESVFARVEAEVRKILLSQVAPMVGLAREANLSGDEAVSEEAWRLVLLLDPGHAEARRALRLETARAQWATAGSAGRTGCLARMRQRADRVASSLPRGTTPATPTRWPGLFRVATAGEAVGGPFRAVAETGSRDAADYVHAMLVGEALVVEFDLVGRDMPAARPWTCLFAQRREIYEGLINANYADDPREAEYLHSLGGCELVDDVWLDFASTPARGKAFAVHRRSETAVGRAFPKAGRMPWLTEGVGVFCAWTHSDVPVGCVARVTSAVQEKAIAGADTGPDMEARGLLAADRALPLVELLGRPWKSFSGEQAAQAFSIICWLTDTSEGAVRDLALALERQKPERACWMALGAPPEAVDRLWRSWAMR
jgi:hypothetical protein